jgi:hypothetical protein
MLALTLSEKKLIYRYLLNFKRLRLNSMALSQGKQSKHREIKQKAVAYKLCETLEKKTVEQKTPQLK